MKLFIKEFFSKCDQGSFISEMEWAPFKYIFWNPKDSVVDSAIPITSDVSL